LHHQDDSKHLPHELYHLAISHHTHLHQHELNVLYRLLYCLSTNLHTWIHQARFIYPFLILCQFLSSWQIKIYILWINYLPFSFIFCMIQKYLNWPIFNISEYLGLPIIKFTKSASNFLWKIVKRRNINLQILFNFHNLSDLNFLNSSRNQQFQSYFHIP
jgi:hypothetical protein